MHSHFKLRINYLSYIPTSLIDLSKSAVKAGLWASEMMDEESAFMAAQKYEELAEAFKKYGYHEASRIAHNEYDYWANCTYELHFLNNNDIWHEQLKNLGMEL